MWNLWLLTPYCSREKFLIILYRSEICTILACFCLFGCHSNSLCSLKNLDDIFEFYNPETPITYVEIGTVLRTKLKSVHFWPFCVYLIAMTTPFAPLKFLLAYLNSPTSKPYHTRKPCLHSFYWTEFCGILVYSYIILVAIATHLARWKIQVAYLNSTTQYLLAYNF